MNLNEDGVVSSDIGGSKMRHPLEKSIVNIFHNLGIPMLREVFCLKMVNKNSVLFWD